MLDRFRHSSKMADMDVNGVGDDICTASPGYSSMLRGHSANHLDKE